MKELKRRAKGLAALLLAMCLFWEAGISAVAGSGMINVGDIEQGDTKASDCADLEFTDIGDGLIQHSSGGHFTISCKSADIADYISLTDNGQSVLMVDGEPQTGQYTCHSKIVVTKELPINYEAIKVTSVVDTGETTTDWSKLYKLTLDWTPAKMCTVQYDCNGGDGYIPDAMQHKISATYTIDDQIDVYNKGHSFLGWSLVKPSEVTENTYLYSIGEKIDFAGNDYIHVEEGDTVTFYAIWSDPYSYTAGFTAGGAGQIVPDGKAPGTMEGDADHPVTMPECDLSMPGYHFAGWKLVNVKDGNSQSGVGDIYQPGDSFDYDPEAERAELLFEAVWEPNHFTISYSANGGNGTVADNVIAYDPQANPVQSLTDGNGLLTREGYTFRGWSLTPNGMTDIITSYEPDWSEDQASVTVYAVWKANAYTIRFDGNGGTGSMPDQNGDSSAPVVLNKNQFTNVEQIFAGWSTSSSGTAQYKDGGSFDFKAASDNQIVDLYAVWTSMADSDARTQINAGTVYLSAGQEYYFGAGGSYLVEGDPSIYPSGTVFYVPESGYYTITIQ